MSALELCPCCGSADLSHLPAYWGEGRRTWFVSSAFLNASREISCDKYLFMKVVSVISRF